MIVVWPDNNSPPVTYPTMFRAYVMLTGRQATLLIWFIGLIALIGSIVWSGAESVGQAVVAAGWATALVAITRAFAVAGAGGGWWLLFPVELRPSLSTCVLLRFVREATNALLPVAQIGGDFIGARCLTLCGVRGMVAVASVIVDILVQAATQLVFAIVGLVLLVAMGGNELLAWPIAIGIALAIPALAGFFMVQGASGQRLARKFLALIVGGSNWQLFGAVDDLFARLGAFYGYRNGLMRSFLWHLASWFIGAIEVWLALRFMGYAITFEHAVIIESLLHAIRGAAFVVPGALGAQEGGLIVLCGIFAVPPEAAVALSLVKRIPDLVIGVPGLIAWQTMEGCHFSGRQRLQPDVREPQGLEEP